METRHETETLVNTMFPWMKPDTTSSAKAKVQRQMIMMFAKYSPDAHERISQADDSMSRLCIEKGVKL